MLNLYSVNSMEVLIWGANEEIATQTFTALYDEPFVKLRKVDEDEIIHLIAIDKETGDKEWTLDPGKNKVLQRTTVKKLASTFDS